MKKTIFKRITALVCAMSLCFAMAGCGKKDPEDITESDVNAALEQMDGKKNPTPPKEGQEVVDPFETLSVEFSGVSPNGYVILKDNNERFRYGNALEGYESVFEFKADKNEGLKNGDVIKVTVSLRRDSGNLYLSQTEKKYTVEGLNSYVDKISDIPESTMEALKKQADDMFTAEQAKWSEKCKPTGKEFMGCYFLKQKQDNNMTRKNMLYLVYKISLKATGVDTKDTSSPEKTVDVEYYTYVYLKDMKLNPDGSCSAESTSYEGCGKNTNAPVGKYDEFWGTVDSYEFYGYDSIESMYKDVVAANAGDYTYESTVNDKA